MKQARRKYFHTNKADFWHLQSGTKKQIIQMKERRKGFYILNLPTESSSEAILIACLIL